VVDYSADFPPLLSAIRMIGAFLSVNWDPECPLLGVQLIVRRQMTLRSPSRVFLVAVAFAGFATRVFADASVTSQADQFMVTLQQGHFADAVKAFHYPETYTEAALSADRAGLEGALERLFTEIGPIQTLARIAPPQGDFLSVALGGGNVPYWAAHPELNRGETLTYRAHVKVDGDVYFVVTLIRPAFGWEIRGVALNIPSSRPGAAARLAQLSQKVFQLDSGKAPPKKNGT
jgi:hypothetical protein